MAKKKKKKKYRPFWFFVKVQMVLFLLVAAGVGWYFFGGYAEEIKGLQKEAEQLVRNSTVDTFKASQTSIVYAADGTMISTLKGSRDSYYLTLDEMPVSVVSAIVSIEDKKFFKHEGIDYRAILRAVKAFIDEGRPTQGGSTITMQLARNTFLSQEKTWQRKVEEMFIAHGLEQKYTKEQILEFYLNNIYFGNGYYGIQSASRGYFNRDVTELDLSEIAFLCAIPNNPTDYDPITNKENTYARRNRILDNMLKDGKISEKECKEAKESFAVLERPETLAKNDYVETYTYYCATRALMEQEGFSFRYEFSNEKDKETYEAYYGQLYGECQRKLYSAGYRIYTSLDLSMQEQLQAAVDETLEGFTETNEEGVYALQSSAVCIDNDNGYVKAIVGGRSQEFSGYTLNRAYQSFRQPGSAIKPLTVYTPSLERGYTPDSMVVDEPIEDGPKNAGGGYAGEMTLRQAVERSVNTIAWKLYEELTPEVGLSYLEEMNFSHLDREDYRLATSLGGFTNGVSALEMSAGYAAIVNDGKYRVPTCIVKILDADGNEVYASAQEEKMVYKQNAARCMTDILTGVLTKGTGKGLSLSAMPSAGKTGTTNDQKDGWFAGYTRYYTTSVWVGYDMPRKMDKLMGSTYPGTIWKKFMESIHENLEPMEFLPYAQMSDRFQNPAAETENGEGENTGQENVPEGEAGQENAAPEENAGQQEGEAGQENAVPQESTGQEQAIPEENAGQPEGENGQEQAIPEENAGQQEGENGQENMLPEENAGQLEGENGQENTLPEENTGQP